MRKREFEGKSVKKAVANACRELNLKSEDLKYKTISHGSSGIFGLVRSRKAKILVTLPPETPDEKQDDTNVEDQEKYPDSNTDTVTIKPSDSEEKSTAGEPITASQHDTFPDTVGQVPTEEIEDISGLVSTGQQFIKQIVDAITSDTTITSQNDNNCVTFNITGGNAALLIGKHGQTLEAVQFLTERAMNRSGGRKWRVEVDVAGYQAKRKNNLVDQAKRMAQKAVKNGRPVTIGPMSPQDRRIIHLTLKPDQRVRTQSNGKGVIRKLTIYPKKKGKRPSSKR